MPRIAAATIREVNERMDALAVIGDYVRLENRGGRYWGLCPFHHEKTPSFTVDPDKKFYHCFGCGEGGSVITFVMNMDKVSFPEAVEIIARKSGIEIIYDDAAASDAFSEERKLAEEQKELYERVAKSFHYILMNKDEGAPARDYLAQRGVSPAMIERFCLGLAPNDRRWLHPFLIKKGYSAAFLAKSGLFSKNYLEVSFFSGRLMFPIHNREGKTVAFGGRSLGNDNPKYLNSSESLIFKKRDTLYGLDFALPEIRRTKEVVLVEGYMDVIAMHQAGITQTAAPLGTAFTEDQAKLLRRYAARARLFFDADAAGQNAAEKAVMTCTAAGLDCRVVDPSRDPEPSGTEGEAANSKDPSEILLKKGANHLKKLVNYDIIPLQFLIARSRSLHDTSEPMGKHTAVARLFPYLHAIESELARSDALLAVADAFFCDSKAVSHDYMAWRGTRGGAEFGENAAKNTNFAAGNKAPAMRDASIYRAGDVPPRLTDELFLLITVLVNMEAHPDFFAALRNALPVDEITEGYAKELYIAMEEWFRAGGVSGAGDTGDAGIAGLFPYIEPAGLRSFVMEKCSGPEFSDGAERLFEDSLRTVRKQRLETRRRDIVQRLRQLGREGSGGRAAQAGDSGKETEELLEDKMYIDRELRSL